jgi:hypothetical protein
MQAVAAGPRREIQSAAMPLPPTMLWRLRVARSARLILCVAALLSVAGSFGLHPEPGGSVPLSLSPASTGGSPQLREIVAPRHGCIACLSQRPHAVTPVVEAPSAFVRVVSFLPPPAFLLPHRLHDANHEGRAPPTA